MHKLQITHEQLLETIQEGIWVFDADSNTTFVNPKMADILGYEVEEMIGKPIFNFFNEEVVKNIEKRIEKRKSGISETYEEKLKHKNGHDVYVEIKATPIIDEEGYYKGGIAGITDISERKHVEEQLKESEEIVRGIVDSAPYSIQLLDPEGYTIKVNEAFVKLFGSTPPKDYSVLNDPHFEPSSTHKNKMSLLAQGERVHFPEAYYNTKLVSNHLPDKPLCIRADGFPLFDGNGKVKYLVLIHENITERKMAEEALRESEAKYRFLAENMGDVAWVMDLDLNTTYISPSSTSIFGFTPEERIQQTVDQIMPPESLSIIARKLQEELAKEENGSFELEREIMIESEFYLKNGGTVWMESLVKALRDADEKVIGIYGSSRDITDRKRAENVNRLLFDISNAVVTVQSLDDLYQSIHAALGRVMDVTNFLIAIVDMQKRTLYFPYHVDTEDDDFLPITDFDPMVSLTGLVVSERQPVLCKREELEKRAHKGGIWGPVPLIWMGTPLMIEDEVMGIVAVQSYTDPDLYSEQDLRVLSAVSDQMASAIARKQAEEQIRYIGFHDQLTNLYNRHYFEKCKEEFKDIPVLSVIMTDVNGLKLVNDTYGHEAGDELLKKYAELLRKSFKQSDLIFRWGGDEFIVILKNTQEAKSWELCNRLIKHCGETFVKDIPLSISAGISSKLQGGDIDKAIQEAEDMMYKNKLTESKSSKNLIMKTLLQTLSEKSFETKGHIDRMTSIGRQFGEKLGLSPSEFSRLETLTMLHDIGKINIDSRILIKETALTDEEWEEIKKHSEVGYRITRTAEEFAYVAEDILAHHEKWDGKGYPQGLKGENIPYLARLLNLIDSYDVMSNGRPYKKKMTREEIIEEIKRCSGKQFDPELAERFIDCLQDGYFDSSNDEWKINK